MNLFFSPHEAKTREDDPGEHALSTKHEQPYADEGSEFLDDLTRTVEQPLVYAGEKVASEGR